jgi:pyruvate-formate lyase
MSYGMGEGSRRRVRLFHMLRILDDQKVYDTTINVHVVLEQTFRQAHARPELYPTYLTRRRDAVFALE